eukprot:GHVH01006460.1.p1 GENE.GHVH01006460.1~~GHVH01006460.1.p1  ORF type:complete len:512 (+),score=74.56 GHVH01006460.1:61-1536(+)
MSTTAPEVPSIPQSGVADTDTVVGTDTASLVDDTKQDEVVKEDCQSTAQEKLPSNISHVPTRLDHHGKLSWDDLQLSPELLKGIAVKGYSRPSNIQEKSLPDVILKRKGYIAQAVNGSGKTASFSLSMLAVCDPLLKATQAICLSHTHELARQNMEVVMELGKYTAFSYHLSIPQCEPMPSSPPQIICGTPGKLFELVNKRQISLNKLVIFVLDEADVMIDPAQNFSAKIMDLHKRMPKGVQTLCFSATYKESVRTFAARITEHCTNGYGKTVLKDKKLKIDCISQHYIQCRNNADKLTTLCELYHCMTVGQSIIFVNKRVDATDVAKMMRKEGHSVSVLTGGGGQQSGSMDTNQREKIMKEFRDGTSKVLIATDVLSRGIDVPTVTLVINYDLPYGILDLQNDASSPDETYLHRIGRTGRFGRPGLAINLIVSGTKEMDGIRRLENKFRMSITSIDLDPEAIMVTMKQLREKVESLPTTTDEDDNKDQQN